MKFYEIVGKMEESKLSPCEQVESAKCLTKWHTDWLFKSQESHDIEHSLRRAAEKIGIDNWRKIKIGYIIDKLHNGYINYKKEVIHVKEKLEWTDMELFKCLNSFKPTGEEKVNACKTEIQKNVYLKVENDMNKVTLTDSEKRKLYLWAVKELLKEDLKEQGENNATEKK